MIVILCDEELRLPIRTELYKVLCRAYTYLHYNLPADFENYDGSPESAGADDNVLACIEEFRHGLYVYPDDGEVYGRYYDYMLEFDKGLRAIKEKYPSIAIGGSVHIEGKYENHHWIFTAVENEDYCSDDDVENLCGDDDFEEDGNDGFEEDFDDGEAEYIDPDAALIKALSYTKFCEIFHVGKKNFKKADYEEFARICGYVYLQFSHPMKYETFAKCCENAKIGEADFEDAVRNLPEIWRDLFLGDAEDDPDAEPDPDNSVEIRFSFYETSGEQHDLCLRSRNIMEPLNLDCWEDDFLSAENTEGIFDIILAALSGDGAEKKKPALLAFRDSLADVFGDSLPAKMELVKIHDHITPMFFGWLRSNALDCNLKTLAQKVCKSSAKNRAENLSVFEEAVASYQPWFPACEDPEWPEFCLYHWKAVGGGYMEAEPNPNQRLETYLDWHGVAGSLEDFAHYLCTKENPKDYAEERVVIDFAAGTIEHTGFYMPGGPERKSSEQPAASANERSEEEADPAGSTERTCEGVQFVVTGKLHVFANREELISYVEKCGGRVTGSVSKKTNYLVNNDLTSVSSKNLKAKELGVEIITEEQFIEKFGH